MTKLPPNARILIVRLTALGDVIHGLPVACALRRAYPNATLGWVVEGRNVELLTGHPALDHVIGVPRRWWKHPRSVIAMRRRLRELDFDVAIDLQCLTKSALAAWLSGAERRIGKSGPDGRELSQWIHNELAPTSGSHVIEHYLSLLQAIGVASPAVEFDVPERSTEATFADEFLRRKRLAPGSFAILNPGAGWPSKVWPAERYGELSGRLAAEHGLSSIAVWGLPAERPMAEAIVASSGGTAQLAPATTVLELGSLCRRAALFVGSDTGPMHLAVAVGTPTISMHGTSRAEWCGAYGAGNRRLQVEYCEGSAQERRRADNWAMRLITVDLVASACSDVLRGASRDRCA